MATLQSILDPLERIEIVIPTGADGREIFREVAALYDNRKVELTEEGHIVVMPPAGIEGGYRSGEALSQLAGWAKQDGTGKAFDSSAGFYITSRENRSPDAAWVINGRIDGIPKADRKGFAPFGPDFAIEVKSPSNSLTELQRKCARYVMSGAFEAWLINPEKMTVEVYRPELPPQLIQDAKSIQGSGPLATFVLDLNEIWAGL